MRDNNGGRGRPDQRRPEQGRRPQRDLTMAEVVDPTRLGLPSGPVVDVSDLRDALIHAQARANVLAPVARIESIPPDHVFQVRVVYFDPTFSADQRRTKGNGAWWITDNGAPALTLTSLNRLGQLAGISITASRRPFSSSIVVVRLRRRSRAARATVE